VSGQALVVTCSEAWPDRFPAAPKASTATVEAAPHDSPLNVALVVVLPPAAEPFTYTPQPVPATLSLDAVQDTVAEVAVAPVCVRPVGAEGAVVSGAAADTGVFMSDWISVGESARL